MNFYTNPHSNFTFKTNNGIIWWFYSKKIIRENLWGVGSGIGDAES